MIVLAIDRRARDVRREQVGGHLNSSAVEVERRGERADQQGLSDAGRSFQEDVAATKQGGERKINRLVLAEDHFGQLLAEHAIVFVHRQLANCRKMGRKLALGKFVEDAFAASTILRAVCSRWARPGSRRLRLPTTAPASVVSGGNFIS